MTLKSTKSDLIGKSYVSINLLATGKKSHSIIKYAVNIIKYISSRKAHNGQGSGNKVRTSKLLQLIV